MFHNVFLREAWIKSLLKARAATETRIALANYDFVKT